MHPVLCLFFFFLLFTLPDVVFAMTSHLSPSLCVSYNFRYFVCKSLPLGPTSGAQVTDDQKRHEKRRRGLEEKKGKLKRKGERIIPGWKRIRYRKGAMYSRPAVLLRLRQLVLLLLEALLAPLSRIFVRHQVAETLALSGGTSI
jgi:hypothetical protein